MLEEGMGSIENAIDLMRFSVEPCIQIFLKTYDDIPEADRNAMPFEASLAKSLVNPNEFLGAVMMTYQATQANRSAMLAMRHHPDVVAKTVEFAKQKEGDKDRRMLHEAVRFVPTPKGATFNFNYGLPTNGVNAEVKKAEKPMELEAGTPDIEELFPNITDSQEGWQQDKTALLKERN